MFGMYVYDSKSFCIVTLLYYSATSRSHGAIGRSASSNAPSTWSYGTTTVHGHGRHAATSAATRWRLPSSAGAASQWRQSSTNVRDGHILGVVDAAAPSHATYPVFPARRSV